MALVQGEYVNISNNYKVTNHPTYSNWGTWVLPFGDFIPDDLIENCTITPTSMYLCGKAQNISLDSYLSQLVYNKAFRCFSLNAALSAYFASTSPRYTTFEQLLDDNASIYISVRISL